MTKAKFVCLATLVAIVLSPSSAGSSDAISSPVAIAVPSTDGELRGMRFPVLVTDSQFNRTGLADIVYVPKTGLAWTGGGLYEARVVALEDRILGFWYHAGSMNLIVSHSTNRYESDLKDTSSMVQTELEQFKAGRWRFAGDPSYWMRLEELLGPAVLRERRGPKIDGWPVDEFSIETRASRFRGVTVEGTNAVVAIEFGTNILAKIAFDKNVVPVWATTNGLSIGPIPTNTVSHIGVKADGQREIKVVY
jgi:hypothetical protein